MISTGMLSSTFSAWPRLCRVIASKNPRPRDLPFDRMLKGRSELQ